jgi:hypothetical protein
MRKPSARPPQEHRAIFNARNNEETEMKLASIGLAAMLSLGAVSATNAAVLYSSTEECIAALGALDVDGDGYIDKAEQADNVKVEANVDSDGDGKVSNAEQTVACRTGAITGLKGNDQK